MDRSGQEEKQEGERTAWRQGIGEVQGRKELGLKGQQCWPKKGVGEGIARAEDGHGSQARLPGQGETYRQVCVWIEWWERMARLQGEEAVEGPCFSVYPDLSLQKWLEKRSVACEKCSVGSG